MSQSDILDVLERHPERWMRKTDIHALLPLTVSSIDANLRRLRRSSFVDVRKVRVKLNTHWHSYLFEYRMRK